MISYNCMAVTRYKSVNLGNIITSCFDHFCFPAVLPLIPTGIYAVIRFVWYVQGQE